MTNSSARKEELPRILVVDDQPANLVAARTLLAPLAADIVTASSGDEALGMVLRYEFAVILMDVRMPVMDGYETAFLIRGHTEHNPVPIIFVTAEAPDQAAMFHGYQSGAVDYLLKPLDEDLLRSKVAVFLELYRHKRSLMQTTHALRRSNEQMARLLEMATDGIVGIEADTRISFVNPAACQMLECRPDQLLHRSARDIFGLRSENVDPFAQAAAHGGYRQAATPFESLLGRRFLASYSLSAVEAERPQGGRSYVLVFHDVTEREGAGLQGKASTLLDVATGLPNRVWLEHRLAESLVRSGRNRPFTMLKLDVDGLTEIVEQHGEAVLAFIMRGVTERLVGSLRATDMAARLDDRRFAVLLPGISEPTDAVRIAEKLVDVLARPFVLTGRPVHVVPHVGIALYPLHGDSAARLLAASKQALGAAKAARSRIQVAGQVTNDPITVARQAGS